VRVRHIGAPVMRANATAPRRRRPSAKGKKSRGAMRERDPVAYYSNKIDRWFDAHPIAGFLVSAMTVFAFLYGAYAVSVATGVYERYLAKRVEPILMKHVAPTYLAIERALRRLA
jgi:hypothetical protein|tara:strand:- start:7408 stop:7752 length:345 start_codon:yes stop_codon:yes gene_type:complete